MMNMNQQFRLVAMVSLLLSLGVSGLGWTQSIKIGVIDTQRVLEEYEPAKIAMQKLEKERDRLQARHQTLLEELRTLQEKLTKQRKFLDEDQITQTENDIRLKQTEIESFAKTAQETLDDMQQTLFDPVLQEVGDYILELGKRENFTMLLRKQLTVLYVKPEFDLTDRVIKELNDRYAKRQAEKQSKSSESAPKEQKPEEASTPQKGQK